MKIFVDDIREAPEGWILCRTITEAIRTIAFFKDEIEEISLDHDISAEVRVNGVYRPFPTEETFISVAYFIGATYYTRAIAKESGAVITCLSIDCPERKGGECRQGRIPKITAHSANVLGCEAIQAALGKYSIGVDIEMKGAAFRKK